MLATVAAIAAFGAVFASLKTILSHGLPSTTAAAAATTATIVRAVDGDTLLIRTDGKQQRVRIIGIDTPESVRPGVRPECGAHRASQSMKKLAPAGAAVTLTGDPTQSDTDRYGRWLRYATVNGRDVGLAQVRKGLADVYIYAGVKFRRADRYQAAERAAKQQRRGVWGLCGGDFHRARGR
jgi:micrococcal nuclease